LSKENILKDKLSELEIEKGEIERKIWNVKKEIRELKDLKKIRNKDNKKYRFKFFKF